MLQIFQRRLATKLKPDEALQVQAQLQARFNSLLAGVRLEYLRRLGVNHHEEGAFRCSNASSLAAGEIFLPEPGTVFFLKIPRDSDFLEAGGVSTQTNLKPDDFLSEVRDAVIQVTGKAGDWEQVSASQGNEPEESRVASLEVSEKEFEAAQEFLKPSSLDLLQQLNQTDSLPLRKLKFPAGDPSRLLQHLEDLDLIRKDYAVISKETGQQILKVASRASLEESKFFSAENVDEVISCTPFCQGLLQNDQWLLILILSQLREMGLGDFGDEVLVSQPDGAPTQVFLGLNQQRFMLVLSNRRLSLDDSYVISAQISACNLEEVVLISTQRVSSLMKHHLNSTNNSVHFHFIDGLKDFQDKLRQVIVEKQRAYLHSLLEPLSELTPVRVPDLVVAKMAPNDLEAISVGPDMPIVVVNESEPLPPLEIEHSHHHLEEIPALVPLRVDPGPPPGFNADSPALGETLGEAYEFSHPTVADLAPDFPEPGASLELPPLGFEEVPPIPHPVDDFSHFPGAGRPGGLRGRELPLD